MKYVIELKSIYQSIRLKLGLSFTINLYRARIIYLVKSYGRTLLRSKRSNSCNSQKEICLRLPTLGY